MGLVWPQTLGGGYDVIPQALAGHLSLGNLLGLLVVKLGLFALALGLGWTGGVFAPALLLETTQDYRIALPAMIACGIATVASQRYSMYTIDTMHLGKHGVVLPWQVSDLRTTPVHSILQTTRHTGYPVLDDADRLVGIITLLDVRNIPLEVRLATPVEAAMQTKLATVRQGQVVADAALVMSRRAVGRLPVVADDDPARLVGILTRSDVLRAYRADVSEEVDARA